MLDPVHGGLLTYYSGPDQVRAEVQKQQFRLVKVIANDYPSATARYVTDWFYYVVVKSTSDNATELTTVRS
jgi:hypothetical protein